MARKSRSVLALALSAALALGTIPAPALAEMAEEAMGTEQVAATQPATKPANDPVPARPAAPAEAQMGEESVAPQSDPAPAADPDPTADAELGTAPIADADPAAPAAGPDATGLSTQSTVASGTWGTCPWDIDINGTLTVRPGTGAEPDESILVPTPVSPWSDYKDQIKSVKLVEESGQKVVLPKKSYALFSGFKNLTSLDLSGADTSGTTVMDSMFSGCSSLATTDALSSLNTSNVKTMVGLFSGCSSLTSLTGISSWNLSSLERSTSMFDRCSSLTSLDAISGWSFPNLAEATNMFYECTSLASLNGISNWSFPKLSDASFMFYRCTSLTSLDDIAGWDITPADNIAYMFGGCTALTSIEGLSQWNVSSTKNLIGLFSGCTSLTSLGPISNWTFADGTYLSGMFYGCTSLEDLRPISNWDTSKVLSMDSMFGSCTKLSSLDPISDWDTSSLESICSMFYGCTALTSVEGISGWNTSKVRSMYLTFQDCTALKDVDLSRWNTSNVRSMHRVFKGCTSLTTLNISSWDTSKLEIDMTYSPRPLEEMFDGCDSLSRISVGAGYVYRYTDAFPKEPAGGLWRSAVTGQTYTRDQIVSSRLGIADTYTLAGAGVTPAPTSLGGTDWSAVYDPEWYANKNPDVADWATRADGSVDGNKLISHFVNNGRGEGRASKRGFELASYYNANADLRRAFGNNWARYYDHYRSSGWRENRACSGVNQLRGAVTSRDGVEWAPVYDGVFYAQRNLDVEHWAKRWFASGSVVDDAALLQHFVNSGAKECRESKAGFDVRSYYNANPDLRAAFGGSADWSRYYRHYATNGSREGRKCTGANDLVGSVNVLSGTNWSAVYDRAFYGQRNPDIASWATRRCGSATVLDDYAMLSHFVSNGRKEGRASKATFELASYYNANADLRRAFGTDWARYYDHYRANGQREGRAATGVGQLRGAATSAEGVNWAPVYDANYYAQRNADVANWARRSFSSGSVLDDAALLQHFVGSGTKEARASKQTFEVHAYKSKNADLARAFGSDWKSYYRHYAKFGVNEHRPCV